MDMPTVISVTHSAGQPTASLQLAIHPDLNGFDGHFDGAPVVPGVLQIYWALRFASIYLRPISALDISNLEGIKFQHLMTPGIEVRLELELVNAKLQFAFSSPIKRYSSGRIAISQ
jgi:3-hydroxymyristoyl/3-hydroxydecanoyl-(acyl carrier protein) dehydratase